MFDVLPVSGVIGAEVQGLDLSQDLDQDTFEKLHEAFVNYKVLFFRGQRNLTPEGQVAFAAHFGPIERHATLDHVENTPEVTILANDAQPARESWHTDTAYQEIPALGTVLRAIEIPSYGRDTCWVDMEAIYSSLSRSMQQFLGGLTAVHDWQKPKWMWDNTTWAHSQGEVFPPVVHPVVRTHPVSGRKAIYVARNTTTRIVELRPDESDNLLHFLFDQVKQPDYQVRFRWDIDSVAMWDNRSTQHYILADRDGHRVMHRVAITGDRPR
jgi:taurine dioxygenase